MDHILDHSPLDHCVLGRTLDHTEDRCREDHSGDLSGFHDFPDLRRHRYHDDFEDGGTGGTGPDSDSHPRLS